MATFKHISSKNADYGAAEQYLTFEHDEFTMKPTLDENGQIIPRTGYLISSLNCGDEDFAIACMRSNLKYGKNQKREDVKSHHYIISFDPRDAADNGLTVDRAQQLGEQFCREHFPGHQALVCTHPDGHNHSGNIHVHIVINSLRIAEVPLLPYMETLVDEVAEQAYEKACEAVANTVRQETQKEDIKILDDYSRWLSAPERTADKKLRDYAVKRLGALKEKLIKSAKATVQKVTDSLQEPEHRQKNLEQVREKARESIKDRLARGKTEADRLNRERMERISSKAKKDMEI